jgi:hypothetical protein
MQFQQALLLIPGQSAEQAAGFLRMTQLNIWMWRYGRAFPRKISVEDAEEMLWKCVQESRQKGAESLKP